MNMKDLIGVVRLIAGCVTMSALMSAGAGATAAAVLHYTGASNANTTADVIVVVSVAVTVATVLHGVSGVNALYVSLMPDWLSLPEVYSLVDNGATYLAAVSSLACIHKHACLCSVCGDPIVIHERNKLVTHSVTFTWDGAETLTVSTSILIHTACFHDRYVDNLKVTALAMTLALEFAVKHNLVSGGIRQSNGTVRIPAMSLSRHDMLYCRQAAMSNIVERTTIGHSAARLLVNSVVFGAPNDQNAITITPITPTRLEQK